LPRLELVFFTWGLLSMSCQQDRDRDAAPASTRTPTPTQAATPRPSPASAGAVDRGSVAGLPAWLKVDDTPLCGLPSDAELERQTFVWLEAEPSVRTQIEASGLPVVGTVIDHAQKRLVVVVEPEFKDWAIVPGKLSPAPTIDLTMRPACHGRAERDRAEATLEQRSWHPRASNTPVSWSPDASIAGYSVTVDDSAPEVAAALEQKLGKLVRVKLGKPQRL
jgi:hypothetical protein